MRICKAQLLEILVGATLRGVEICVKQQERKYGRIEVVAPAPVKS